MTPVAEQVLHKLSSQLPALEHERVQLAERSKRQLLLLAVTCAGCALAARLGLDSVSTEVARVMPVLILFGGIVIGAWQIVKRQHYWKGRILDTVIPAIRDVFGELSYQPAREAHDFLPAFVKLGLVGSSSKSQLQHYFFGSYKNAGFELLEATLKSGGSDSKTFFEGLLLRIQRSDSSDQRLLITPRVSIQLLNKRGDMQEVLMGDPVFDEKFVVHHELKRTDGAAMARATLSEDFRCGLLEFHRLESRQASDMPGFVVGVMYDSLYMAVTRFQKTRSFAGIRMEGLVPFLDVRFFLFSESMLAAKVATMVEDIAIVHRVIDTLSLARDDGAGTPRSY